MGNNKNLIDRILIVVRGGTIQGVFSSNEKIKVDILDYDDEEFLDNQFSEIEFEIRKQNFFELPLQ